MNDTARTCQRLSAKRHEMWNCLFVDRIVTNTRRIWLVFKTLIEDRRILVLCQDRLATSETINPDQNRTVKDPAHALPPKSPSSRRLMPTLPTKAKRGEVMLRKIYFCTYVCVWEHKRTINIETSSSQMPSVSDFVFKPTDFCFIDLSLCFHHSNWLAIIETLV